jgi:RHS repeat-associated protein
VNDTTDIPFKATYTAFGVETAAAPDWLPFGFAGGLYDPDTGLVRFGARDYDPQVGRWTSKDPLLFKGRSTNLYAYASGDPVNRRDSRGTADDVDGTQNFFMCAMDLMFCVECAAPELDPFKVAACAECLGKVLGDVDNSSCHKPFGSWDHTVPDPPAPPPMVCPKGSRLYEEHLPWPMLDPGPECIPTCKGDDCPNMCGGDGYDPDIEKLQ